MIANFLSRSGKTPEKCHRLSSPVKLYQRPRTSFLNPSGRTPVKLYQLVPPPTFINPPVTSTNVGRKLLHEKFPEILPTVRDFVASSSFAASAKRDRPEGKLIGVSSSDLRNHVLQKVGAIKSCSVSTIRKLGFPANRSRKARIPESLGARSLV